MELNQFIVKANKRTYASGNEGKKLSDGGKAFVYEEDGFKLRDVYYGFSPFAGQTVVWKDDEPVWIMNYYGFSKSDDVSDEEIFAFLQKALMNVKDDRPFRGPPEFKEGDFRYTDRNEGDINRFTGIEKVLYKGWEVHWVFYQGGMIGKK
jgi:hypothetical protein